MEGLMKSVQQVWCSIKYWVSWIALKLKDVNVLTRRDESILQCFNLPLTLRKEIAISVKWKHRKPGWVKLNVDGCSLGNPGPSGAGGIIRNHKRDLVCGFSVAIGHYSNNFAELMSLLHGLRHIDQMGHLFVEIELDSMLVINWLRSQRRGLWYMEDYWEEIQSRLAGLHVSFVHCYQESNSVADDFAKLGAKGLTGSWTSLSELPAHIRGNFRLDRGGLPYVQKVRRVC
ncbi:ribonuclease H-like [Juglans microcarpa x Juglans regia]|uniref:ribonuclease H-like n=1 Tax=Juglans microcarpa x Juglans regia TaxID=2249226 RepID=UPI001B7EC7A0|nr:ribonuclease H-like [Juglans microcarpa x Juglans regia]